MTVPHYISEGKSDMRGIKPGWYAIEDDGNLSFGPFSSTRNASRESISRPTAPTRLSRDEGRTETRLYGHLALSSMWSRCRQARHVRDVSR
jgi:hypothetical protein